MLLFLFFCRKIVLLFVLGRSLWRQDVSVICSAICQWSESPRTRNHILLSHLRLIRFPFRHLLRLAGLRWKYSYPLPHEDYNSSSKSVSMSRYRANSGTCDRMLLSVRRLLSESCCLVAVWRPLLWEVGSVICHSQSIVIYQYLHQAFTLHVFYTSAIYIQYIQSPSEYSRLCSTSYY
jgi:hypothetical protein